MKRQRSSSKVSNSGRPQGKPGLSPGAELRTLRPATSFSRKRLLILGFLLLALSLVFLILGGPRYLTNHFAGQAAANHDHAGARFWLNRGESLRWLLFDDGEADLLAARMARREGDLDTMERHLFLARQAGLSISRAERERLFAEVQSGQFDDAKEYQINEWLKEGDQDAAEICDAYANGLAIISRLDDALRVLQAWQQDQPQHPVPPYRIGKIHEYYDNVEQAQASYQTSVENSPTYYPALFRLASLHLDAKRPREAKALFERCLAMPEPLSAEIGVALSLIELGETATARDKLVEVLAHPKQLIDASYRSVQENPETFAAAAELGKLYVNTGDYEQGIHWLNVALQANPRDLSARYSRAVAYQQSGETRRAAAEFEEVAQVKKALEQVNVLRNQIGREPTDADARVELGRLLLRYESERNAVFWLKSALTFDPRNQAAHLQLAEYYESKSKQTPELAPLAARHRKLANIMNTKTN